MPYKDPEKNRKCKRDWARKNRRVKSALPYVKAKKQIIFEAKNHPCAICKHVFPTAAMDLHHVDPTTKEFTIATALKKVGYERLVAEIGKCVALCAVCHRLLHAGLVDLDVSQ